MPNTTPTKKLSGLPTPAGALAVQSGVRYATAQMAAKDTEVISLAYTEKDGLLLSAAFLAAIILIGIGSAAVRGTVVGAVLISAW
jgi:hypothetical protein